MKYLFLVLFSIYGCQNSFSQNQEALMKWLLDESNIVDTFYNKEYHKNGQLRIEETFLRKAFDEKISYSIQIGISKSFDEEGNLDAEYQFDEFGQLLFKNYFHKYDGSEMTTEIRVDVAKGYFIVIKKDFFEIIPMRRLEKIKKNGQILHKGEYFKKKKHGKWIWYFPDGVVEKEIIYDKGKKVSKNKTSVKNWLDGNTNQTKNRN